MLIKARVSAGDREPGARLLDFVEPLIYQSSLDFRAVEAVSETRQRISEKMAARRGAHGGLDVKLTPGGIRDIEFLVQCLQRLHGGREPWVRHGGTMLALSPPARQRPALRAASMRGSARRTSSCATSSTACRWTRTARPTRCPAIPTQLDLLARKMPPDGTGVAHRRAAQKLDERLAGVKEIYERVIHAQRPMYYTLAVQPDIGESGRFEPPPRATSRGCWTSARRSWPRVAKAGCTRPPAIRTFPGKGRRQPRSPRPPGERSDLAEAVFDIFEHSS